jgi:uroporphyrinogen-III synthase
MAEFTIFVSRNSEDVKELQEFCTTQNWNLISKSLIEFRQTTIQLPNQWDIIFFPSPRAVDFFFTQYPTGSLSNKKIACAGKGTALTLLKHVEKVDFIPSNSGVITEVQSEFQEWAGDKKIIYIGSNQSRKSVLVGLTSAQYIFVQGYETLFKPEQIIHCNCYIFSSPSNVESFFSMNQLPIDAMVISWGQSTTDELTKWGVKPTIELKSGSQSELISCLSN